MSGQVLREFLKKEKVKHHTQESTICSKKLLRLYESLVRILKKQYNFCVKIYCKN